jgi:hypothetical protein
LHKQSIETETEQEIQIAEEYSRMNQIAGNQLGIDEAIKEIRVGNLDCERQEEARKAFSVFSTIKNFRK